MKDGERLRVSLNQYWRFYPVEAQNVFPPIDINKWGMFIVPGHWSGGNICNHMLAHDGSPLEEWHGKAVKTYPSAWYERTIDVPIEWHNHEIILDCEYVNNTASIFINGKEIHAAFEACGNIGNRIKERIDQYIDYGKVNTIRLRVDGGPVEGSSERIRGGLFGDVSIWILPKLNLGEPVIRTYFDKKNISISFINKDELPEGSIGITITDENTKETVYDKTVPLSKIISIPYVTPKLWSCNSPNLYNLKIILYGQDGKLLDSCSRVFGFREFKIVKDKFLLNNNPIVFKMDTAVKGFWTPDWEYTADYFRRELITLKKMGLNALYIPDNLPEALLNIADENGMLLISRHSMPYMVHESNTTEYILNELKHELDIEVNNPKFYNHPSFSGFLIDIWYNFHNGTTNPEFVGLKKGIASYPTFSNDGNVIESKKSDPNLSGMRAERKARLDQMAEMFHRYFPDMLCFTGGSGEVDGIYATHMYHTWGAPLAELRAMFSRWSMQRDLPIFIGETCIPYQGSFYTINDFNAGKGSNPLFKENFARIKGNDAYKYKGVYGRRPLHDHSSDSLIANMHESSDGITYNFTADIYLESLEKYLNDIVLPWRYSGVSGFGMFCYVLGQHFTLTEQTPKHSEYKILGNLSFPGLKAEKLTGGAGLPGFSVTSPELNLRPTTLATPFIKSMSNVTCGFGGKGDDIFEKDHAWFGGEILNKSFIILNDTGNDLSFDLNLSLINELGELIKSEDLNVEVSQFEYKSVPIEWKLPTVNKRSDWTIRAQLSSINQENVDIISNFVFQIYPFPVINDHNSNKLFVYDPENRLSLSLINLGYKFTKLQSLDGLLASGTLLVGRKGLSYATSIPDFSKLAENGLNVLIMEQDQTASGELMCTRSREAFINASAHPILAGFKDIDFSNWRGSRSILQAYTNSTAGKNWTDWGNRNMLAGIVFRRPAHGNYLGLLVNGFDAFQTPLLEYRGKKGSWIGSQLEITDRVGIDPVATHILVRMIDYLSTRGRLLNKTAFFCKNEGMSFFDQMKLSGKYIDTLDQTTLSKFNNLVLISPDFNELKKYRFEINDFVYAGGKIIYIQKGNDFVSSWLPFPMKLGCVSARQSLCRGEADMLWRCGWGNNDLYWHDNYSVPIFRDFPPQLDATDPAVIVQKKYGSGLFIFCSITPELFGESPACGKTTRVISSVLTDAGISISGNNNSPYMGRTTQDVVIDLAPLRWEFSLDPKNIGTSEHWEKGGNDSGEWISGLIDDGVEVLVGQPFETFIRKEYDGCVWYRLNIELQEADLKANNLHFIAGAIDDIDEVFINSVKIGSTGEDTPQYWSTPRRYSIPANILKEGNNLIAVKVTDLRGNGGIIKLPLELTTKASQGMRIWNTPYPAGSNRDYDYKADIIRMY